MKVALVHDYLTEYGGAERVLEVLHEIYPDAPVYTSLYNIDKMPAQFRSWNVQTSFLQRLPFAFALQKPLTYLLPWAFELFDLNSFDLVISSTSCAAHGLVLRHEVKHIVYCHTPAKFAWGLLSSNPRTGLRGSLRPLDWLFMKWDFAAAQRADRYLANSGVVKERIKEFYGRDSVVVYPPIDKNTQYTKNNTQQIHNIQKTNNESYYLVVSRLEKLKNIDMIIRACLRQKRKLKIAGKGTHEKYLKSISDNTIEFLGFVPDEDLPGLYANATALVLAAENEDFGITPVEAHLYGCPVLAYKGGGYTETVIEGVNGHFFEELNVDVLENGFYEIEAMKFDRSKIVQSAERFSKERFVREIKGIVEQVLHKNNQ